MSVWLDESASGLSPSRWRPRRGPAPRRVLIDSAVAGLAVPTPALPRSPNRRDAGVVATAMHRSSRRWWPPVLVVGCVLFAGGENASVISTGQRPGELGVVASLLFLTSWVGYLAASPDPHRHAALRRLNACWAAIIAGSALTASVVGAHLSLTGGQLTEAALTVVSFLLAAPLYGLTGLIGGEHFPLGMAGLAVACYLALLAFAVARLHLSAHRTAAGA